MTWKLEIHHIGLDRSGDATLILAINDGVGANQMVQVRAVLIDGGLATDRARVHDYLQGHIVAPPPPLAAAPAVARPLNVIVVTHYDQDHFNGITSLLNLGGVNNIYDDVIIFDQGESQGSTDNTYINYGNAINSRGNRHRVTATVNAINYPHLPPGALPARWLLGREIMWTNNAGNPVTPAALLPGALAGTNLNPPTVTCISANRFISSANPPGYVRRGGVSNDAKNEHSLGFIVQFNNFRYYIAGDLETDQENQVQVFLNPNNDLAGRVVAIKASHHGANTATSRAFVDRLRPDAAFISCGNQNQYGHPAWEAVNVLGGHPAAAAPPPLWPAPPQRPVHSYLTGYYRIQTYLTYGDPANTAGDPNAAPPIAGTVKLTVSQAQSTRDQRGDWYFGIREAVWWAARRTGATNAQADQIGDAAANAVAAPGINNRLAAVQAAVTAAVQAVAAGGLGPDVSVAASAAASLAMNAGGPRGVNYRSATVAEDTTLQTMAASGGSQTVDAVAGAAAGAAFCFGKRDDAAEATHQALFHAGISDANAVVAAQNCLNTIGVAAGPSLFTVSFHDHILQGVRNKGHTG